MHVTCCHACLVPGLLVNYFANYGAGCSRSPRLLHIRCVVFAMAILRRVLGEKLETGCDRGTESFIFLCEPTSTNVADVAVLIEERLNEASVDVQKLAQSMLRSSVVEAWEATESALPPSLLGDDHFGTAHPGNVDGGRIFSAGQA